MEDILFAYLCRKRYNLKRYKMNALYETSVEVTGGRNGKVKSEDGILELDVRIPKQLGGAGGHTNPEQLFAAGYAACFDSALNLVMGQAKVKPSAPSRVKATVGLIPNEQGGYGLQVALSVTIPGMDHEQARQLVDKAHSVCPYSNAIRGNVDVQLQVV